MRRIQLIVLVVSGSLGVGVASPLIAEEESEGTVTLGFEQGDLGKTPRGWFVPTQGWKAELSEEQASSGKRSVKLSLPGESNAPFGNVMRTLDIDQYRGKRIRLSAKIRVQGANARAQMWLRVDRPNQQMGFFDNMGDRPVTASKWTEAVIEGDIDKDGLGVVCGIMSIGGGTVYADDVRLTVEADALPTQEPSPPMPLSDRGLQNLRAAARLLAYVRFFHPSDEVMAVEAWDHFAVDLVEAAEPATNAGELAKNLGRQVAVIAPSVSIWAGAEDDAPKPPRTPEEVRSFRYWVHYGAGRVATGQSIYSSVPKTIKRDDLNEGQPPSGGLLKSLIGAVTGDGEHHRPAQPLVTKSLGGGVSCRLPILVAVGPKGSFPKATGNNPWSSSSAHPKLTAANRSTRLAGVAVCWGVMQHFYPYFDVVNTDWDEALDTALQQAAEDQEGQSYLRTLQQMVAKLHDGHGNVYSQHVQSRKRLPLALDWAGDDCVVVGTHESVANKVEVGDVILGVNEKSFPELCAELSSRVSAATNGWRRTVLLGLLVVCDDSDAIKLRMRKPGGSEYEVSLALVDLGQPVKRRLERAENGSELADGIVYFDLNGATSEALEEVFDTLQAADGIVFDLRGYPADAAHTLMRHLVDEPAASAQWNVPVVTLPDRERWTWRQSAWDLRPSSTPLDAEIAFLTDGRAISYAESIMGIVEHYKLGDIVGATTAGTNGNVNPFSLPGGYRVVWTGMKVLKHDGSQHHGVGILPTVPVAPTPQGIAEGRDEVLERAIDVLTERIAKEK